MQKILLAVCVLSPMLTFAQESAEMSQMMAPPAEMKELESELGDFSGDMTMYEMDGSKVSGKGSYSAKMILGGRFMQQMHSYEFAGMKMLGMYLQTFDPQEKKWVAWWYDQMSPMAMKFTETAKDDTMVQMVSDPTPNPMMPEPMVMRHTWKKLGGGKFEMKLEMQTPGGWVPMIDGTYAKK